MGEEHGPARDFHIVVRLAMRSTRLFLSLNNVCLKVLETWCNNNLYLYSALHTGQRLRRLTMAEPQAESAGAGEVTVIAVKEKALEGESSKVLGVYWLKARVPMVECRIRGTRRLDIAEWRQRVQP